MMQRPGHVFEPPGRLRATTTTFSFSRLGPCLLLVLAMSVAGCSRDAAYDVVIRNGTIYDGSGQLPFRGDLAIAGDTIAALGQRVPGKGRMEIDAHGLAVAPGFINMLSWANESLIEDGRSQSDIRQGVTLEVFGEGETMGPLNDAMKREMLARQTDTKYAIEWTTLGEYLAYLERRGISPNVASFVGATTVRVHELGYANRPPTPDELERMKQLVHQAMDEGAFGVGSSLIYAPAFYARTEELIALAGAAAPYGGMYISHIRGEAAGVLGAVDELLQIARGANVPAEIYHLKAAGQANWHLMDSVMERIERARAEGLAITADMYTYTAAATGLDAAMPPWVQEGGFDAWAKRLRDPAVRRRVEREMREAPQGWENLYYAAGSAGKLLLVGFRTDSLKYLTGKTLADVAAIRGVTPETAAMDLVVQDNGRVDVVYFLMSEENVRAQLQRPWVSFGSDAASMAPEGVLPSLPAAPADVRQRRAAAREVRAGGEADLAARGGQASDGVARGQPRARSPRPAACRILRGCGRVRSRSDRGSRDIRPAAPVRDRRAPRVREWGTDAEGW